MGVEKKGRVLLFTDNKKVFQGGYKAETGVVIIHEDRVFDIEVGEDGTMWVTVKDNGAIVSDIRLLRNSSEWKTYEEQIRENKERDQ